MAVSITCTSACANVPAFLPRDGPLQRNSHELAGGAVLAETSFLVQKARLGSLKYIHLQASVNLPTKIGSIHAQITCQISLNNSCLLAIR
jgi:hypothetical protein